MHYQHRLIHWGKACNRPDKVVPFLVAIAGLSIRLPIDGRRQSACSFEYVGEEIDGQMEPVSFHAATSG
jgi:hypothetical protein